MTLVYIDCYILPIVDISGCMLVNMALYMAQLSQTALAASEVHLRPIIWLKVYAVIYVFKHNNTMFMLNHIPMCDLCAYLLGPPDRSTDDESKQDDERYSGRYTRE